MSRKDFLEKIRKLNEVETIKTGNLNTYGEGLVVSISYVSGISFRVYSLEENKEYLILIRRVDNNKTDSKFAENYDEVYGIFQEETK